MGCFSFFLVALLLVLFHGQEMVVATNCSNPVIFVFGDSNSDTGGFNAYYGSLTTYPTGGLFPFPPSERASNGRLVIDFLCENVTANYLKAYLNSFEPDFGNGVNFAISGSSATYLPELKTQVNQFGRFQNRSSELHSKGSSQKLVGEEGFKLALYVFDIGQNDLAKAFDKGSYGGMIERIPNITAEIKKAMQVIYGRGGRRFWVHNTGPLGCLPLQLSSKKPNATDLDPHGCIKYLNEGAQMLNTNLSVLCQELRSEMNDATIVYLDMYAIKYDLIANASSYGFEDPFTACYDGFKLCAEQSKHISWDGTHYTDAANAFVASKVISANYSTPPLPFNFFCDCSVI